MGKIGFFTLLKNGRKLNNARNKCQKCVSILVLNLMTTLLYEAYFKNMTGSTPTLQRMGTLVQCEINSAKFFFQYCSEPYNQSGVAHIF